MTWCNSVIFKTCILIAGCVICSVIIIIGLYFVSHHIQRESFTRLFPPHVLSGKRELQLNVNSYYISGVTDSKIYLSNYSSASHLMEINYYLSDTHHIKINFPEGTTKISTGFTCSVDSPYIYLVNGLHLEMFTGQLPDVELVREKLPIAPFDIWLPVSRYSIVARIYDSLKRQNIITKMILDSGHLKKQVFVPDKQQDGIFSIDGLLNPVKGTGLLSYVYFYQNQFAILDTNLNTVYSARTIDTNKIAKITLSTVSDRNSSSTMFSSPPKSVNKFSCTDKEYVYINSRILSTNEEQSALDHNSVIDVYYLKNGQYKFSFYLPDDNYTKCTSFRVANRNLFAIYGSNIYAFQLNF